MRDESYWLRVISGEDRRLSASFLRSLLWLIAPLYGLAVRIRNLAYTCGWKKTYRANLPIISVGNLTTGGTGKLPFVIWLAQQLRSRDRRVCVLSRGYKGTEQGENDESLELADRLPDVPQLVNPDRIASAQIAVDELEMEVALLDDGFQHRRLQRDLDLVLVDATQPFGYGQLLPRGLLREPKSSLRRASRIVITRANLVSSAELDQLKQQLGRYHPTNELAVTITEPTGLLQADGRTTSLDQLAQLPVFAFCGLGNSTAFFKTVEPLSGDLVGQRAFPDHHAYSPQELNELAAEAKRLRAGALLCSHKDLVKIGRSKLGEIPLYALLIEIRFLAGEDSLLEAVNACLPSP
ncbi:MAG: tetraacyldisaccharide 4'-kinase [Planctomycetota bacterium]